MISFAAATTAAIPIYGSVVAVPGAAAAATTTAPPSPFAAVAQGRAPIIGDMGAKPIFGKYGH